MRVDIRLLGGFEVAVDGQVVPASRWHRRSAAALVKLLALAPRRRLLREQVMDALWPDLLLDEASPRLHKATHYARAALGSGEAVVVEAGSLALFPSADLRVDVAEFECLAEAALADASPGSAREAVDCVRRRPAPGRPLRAVDRGAPLQASAAVAGAASRGGPPRGARRR